MFFQVVDTSHLVNSPSEILLSDRVACFLDQEQEMSMLQASNFPRNHLLYRVFNEKTYFSEDMDAERKLVKNERCFLQRDPSMERLSMSEKIFFVGSHTLLSFVLPFIGMLEKARQKGIWISGEHLFEYNLVRTSNRCSNRNLPISGWLSISGCLL